MKKKMSNRDKTFWAVVIPVVILFFAFNTLPMIKGVIYSFTNYKGYGTYDYDDYESLKDEEVVENYEEFEKMWHEEYPDEISWYHLVTIERDDYRAIFLGRELIYQSRILEAHSSYEYNVEELFVWMQDAVKKCIA